MRRIVPKRSNHEDRYMARRPETRPWFGNRRRTMTQHGFFSRCLRRMSPTRSPLSAEDEDRPRQRGHSNTTEAFASVYHPSPPGTTCRESTTREHGRQRLNFNSPSHQPTRTNAPVECNTMTIPEVIAISPSQSQRRGAAPSLKKAEEEPLKNNCMELFPGEYRRLRTTQETKTAIAAGKILCADRCGICNELVFAMDNVNYVICPKCRTVGPTNTAAADDAVGLGFTLDTLQKIRNNGSSP